MKTDSPPDKGNSDPAEDTDDQDSNDEDKDGESSGSDASDSSDSTEKCPICLLSFHDQEIGSPNVCEHVFCVPCIEVWSRSVKTCPIDRLTFTSINVFKNFEDRTQLRTISVDSNSNKELVLDEPVEEEDLTLCEICNRADREEILLLCDGCNRGYHIDCLTPALPEVPHGSWYCDNCFSSHSSSESDEGEINDLLNELENVGGHLLELGRLRHQPRITRTRQSERIRNTILSTTGRRVQVATTSRQVQSQPSTSRSSVSAAATRSTSKPRVVRKKRRKKYKRRTRTVVVEYDLNSDSKFPVATKKVKIVRRRRKRKVKRKTKSCKTSSSTHGSSKNTASSSTEVGSNARRSTKQYLPTFTLMGPKRDMDVLFSDSEEDEAYTRAINSGSSLMLSIRNARQGRNLLQTKSSLVATSTVGPNLLDTIMQSMDGLKSKNAIDKGKTENRPTSTKITVNSATIHTDESTSSTVPAKDNQSDVAGTSTNGGSSHQAAESGTAATKSQENPISTVAANEDSNRRNELLFDEPLEKSPEGEKKVNKSEDDKGALAIFDLPTLDSLPSVSKFTLKYDDEGSDNECPNFSVYSEETMALLTKTEGNAANPVYNESASPAKLACEHQDFDEDLVQMSDNDENLQDAGEIVLNKAKAEDIQKLQFDESYNDQEANTPTLDERYPDEIDIKSPDDQQRKNSNMGLTPSPPPPPNRHQNFEQNEIQSPDQDIFNENSVEERPKQSRKTCRKAREKRRNSSNEEDEDSDDAQRKRRRKDQRKKNKKEHRKRSRSRSKRRKSQDRGKKRDRSRSPVPQRERRPRSRPRNHDNKSSRKQRPSRSRSRSLSHRWSPVQRRSRSKSRSITPPRSNAPLHSKKDKSRTAPATSMSVASSSNKRSTATTKPKDVFKSGKNILVSVNFEKSNKFEYSNDPVAIIDLTNGVKETIPSAKNIIEVSDSEHEEEKVPDNSLIGAVKATIESKLKATAPPKPKPKPQLVAVVPQPQTSESGKMQSTQTERLLSQIKTAFVDGSKRGGSSIVPDKPSKVLPVAIAPRDSPEVTSGYDYLPYSPGSSDYDNMYDDPNVDAAATSDASLQGQDQPGTSNKASGGGDKAPKNIFNDLFGQSPVEGEPATSKNNKSRPTDKKASKEKYIDKLNMQKRASDEAKLCLKPFYNSKQITKDDYKDILRRAVPKICRGGEIRPQKIEALVAAYVRTIRHKSKHGGNKIAKN